MDTEPTIESVLLGTTITEYDLAPDGAFITFHRQNLPSITLDAVGECCSRTWIEDIDAPNALIGTVLAVEHIKSPNISTRPGPRYDEYIQYYGLKITTKKGRCVIDYRNASNGYYGGELVLRVDNKRL